ncbi:MAG TPA: RsmE family RNA methyltransferase [Candidatus Binatia bacterium]|nr:RsmE family RNA methyltransferase [Candidatus Binatia bacterium]
MTRRRWIADEFSRDRAALTGAHAAHLARTLRARVGQQFDVACGDEVRRATVSSVADDRVEFALAETIAAGRVAPITLLLAIFRFDRMEWAIEKCTELDVTWIVPVIARRTEKHLATAAARRVERWRRIAREASEQARRVSPAQIADPMKLKAALAQPDDPNISAAIPTEELGPGGEVRTSGEKTLRIVLAEAEREVLLNDVLRLHPDVESLSLAIGPEGGWTSEELQSFASSHWIAASLGQTILRAETAAIAALAIARAEI